MSSTSRQARRELLDQLKQQPKDKLPEKRPADDQEIIGPDQQIQPENARAAAAQLGNTALARMLREAGRQDGPALEIEEVQEEEQDQEEDQEEAWDEQLDTAFTAQVGSMGVAGASMESEDWEHDYGGDDDAPPPPPPRRPRAFRRGWQPPNNQVRDRTVASPDEDPLELPELPPLAHPADPQGDERFDALWGCLTDPRPLVGPHLQPEDLVQPAEPLAIAQELGTFFARAARDPLARALGRVAGPLPGPATLACQSARAAGLATLAGVIEAGEGPVEPVNQAAVVALERDARARCRAAAHQCVQRARLAAHLIFDEATRAEDPPGPGPQGGTGRRARGLIEAAILHTVRPWPLRPAQGYARGHAQDSTADADTADLDALLAELTGAPSAPTVVEAEALQPLIDSTETLVGSAGRAQVELAAAALVVLRATGGGVRPRARALLRAADRELRELARSAVFTGRDLEAQLAQPLDTSETTLRRAEDSLHRLTRQLELLRESSFSALGAMALVGPDRGRPR